MHSDPDGYSEALLEACARAAHEVLRAYNEVIGDAVAPEWERCPHHMRTVTRNGVLPALQGTSPADSHARWCEGMAAQGWVWGPAKDPARKQHPYLTEFDKLPESARAKDHLFVSVVRETARAYLAGASG